MFENFVRKYRQNVLLEVNFSKFLKIVLFEAGKGYFSTQKKGGRGKWVILSHFYQKG